MEPVSAMLNINLRRKGEKREVTKAELLEPVAVLRQGCERCVRGAAPGEVQVLQHWASGREALGSVREVPAVCGGEAAEGSGVL